MKTTVSIALLLLSGHLAAQAFYYQTFGTGGSFPSGWSSTDSRIVLNSDVPSSGYQRSATSPQASGGNNVVFKRCSPNSGATLYLNCSGVVNTSGKSNIRVGFGRRKTGSFDKAVVFQYSTDGSNWNDLDADVALGATTTWDVLYYDLPPDASGVSNLQFRFGFVSNVNDNCTAAQNFRIDDFTVGENESLPVTLVNFSIQPNPTSATLTWATATELNSDYFMVERSNHVSNFESIASVAAAGNSTEINEYSYTDERPLPGKNYYRLKQVDFDGKYSFSPVVTATFGKTRQMTLAPLPATETLNIQLETPTQDDGIWQVYDLSGRLHLSGEMPAETTEQLIQIAELSEGAYVLRLRVGQGVMVEQFRKN